MPKTKYSLDNIKHLENKLCSFGLEIMINSPNLQRLKDIRLLGTMQYVQPLENEYSRYEHSLAVAYLTLSVVELLHLSDLAAKVSVLAALLHDVGHMALSHGAEVFLHKRQGKYHENHTHTVINNISKELSIKGKDELATRVRLAGDLLSGGLLNLSYRKLSNCKSLLNDEEIIILDLLATGPMSVDMIEGVTRTARSIGLTYPDPITLISSIHRDKRELTVPTSMWSAVWELFELERTIYNDYIYSSKGMAAEAMLTRALELSFPKNDRNPQGKTAPGIEYDPTNDFLNMKDHEVLSHIQKHTIANDILQRLEARDLFVPLSEFSSKIHADVVNYLRDEYDTEDRKRSIEDALASVLQIGSSHVIVHSTIRKMFKFSSYEPLRLFSKNSPFSEIQFRTYSEIKDQFKAERVADVLCDAFIPDAKYQGLEGFSLPMPQIKPTDFSAPVSRRFEEKKSSKNGMVATPQEVADFLATWAVRSTSDNVLDPSCGDGAFLNASLNRLLSIGAPREVLDQIYGVERQPGLWHEMRDLWQERIVHRDFFEISPREAELPLFDVIVGNPPYVRAHRFKGENRTKALEAGTNSLADTLGDGVKLTQGSNTWAPFLLHACRFLSATGRLAMVLPTELLTADYAKPIREFLSKRFRSISFVLLKKRIFEEEQDTLLLLADSVGNPGIYRSEVDCIEHLNKAIVNMAPAPNLSGPWRTDKWTVFLTNQEVLDLMDSLLTRNVVVKLGSILNVKIGIVTGNSKFFVLKPSEAEKANLKGDLLLPIIAKAHQIPGAILTIKDVDQLRRTDSKHLLLRIPPDTDLATDPDLQRYLEKGREQGIHSLQKCRTRWPWYSVPYSTIPQLFLTYMSGKRCRICLNQAKINCTNNIHQLHISDEKFTNVCAASFYSSLTGLSVELSGRGYGGGLIKLDPSDAKMLLMPNFKKMPISSLRRLENFLPKIDFKLRTEPDNGVWEELDDFILTKTLGLSAKECAMIQQEYLRLRNRRANRGTENSPV